METKIQHISNLDILRALAVLGVVAHHTKAVTGFNFPFLGDYGGLLGVELFFLVSGYLITDSVNRYSLRDYAVHRAFRIFPAYWVAYFGVAIFAGFPAAGQNWSWSAFLLNLVNLQQLLPAALIQYDTLHVTWTLTVELFWYLCAPLFVLGGRRIALAALAGSAVVSTAWSVLAAHGAFTAWFAPLFAALPKPADPGQVAIIINNAFPAQIVFFLMGGCIYYYREFLLRLNATLLNAALVGFVLLIALYQSRLPSPIFLSGIGLSALFILFLRARPIDDWLLLRIGKISYSVYLLHFPLIILVVSQFGGRLGQLSIVLAMGLIFLLSNLLYEYVEKPFIALGAKLSGRALPGRLASQRQPT